MLHNKLNTTFDWKIQVDGTVNPRSVQNFPMQANGAEMLRLAAVMAMEQNIQICAPIHDAILIESSVECIDEEIKRMQIIMQRAGEIVLDGFTIRSDVDKVVYPDRYMDEGGAAMWDLVMDACEIAPDEPLTESATSTIQKV